jgi:hypothetical protein
MNDHSFRTGLHARALKSGVHYNPSASGMQGLFCPPRLKKAQNRRRLALTKHTGCDTIK